MSGDLEELRRELALVEREDLYYVLSRDKPFRRALSLPVHDATPSLPFRTSPYVVNNTFPAGGKRWLGYLEGETDAWHLAYFDHALRSVVKGVKLTPAPDQPSENPRPVSISQDPEFPDQIYVVDEYGIVRFWNGANSTVDTSFDAAAWQFRTQTDALYLTADKEGWGYIGDLYTEEPDLQAWDGLTYQTWLTADHALALADAGNTPGYGYFWYGHLVYVFYYLTRWWGLATGYIYDEGEFPATDFGPAALSIYACNALLQCEAGTDPTDPGNWTRFKYPITPWEANSLHGKWNGADKLHTSFHYWVEWRDSQPYIGALPYQPNDVADYNQVAIYTIDPSGAVIPYFEYQNVDSYSGPLTVVGGQVHVVISDHNQQKVQLWQPDDDFMVAPTLIAETAWTGDPDLGTALYHNGASYVVLGQHHDPIGGDTLNSGDGAATGWGVLRYTYATDLWATAPGIFPGAGATAFGVMPRLLPTRPNAGGQGGGGGGGDPIDVPPPSGTGSCDGEYAPYQTSTITFAFFEDYLNALGSPILTEQSAAYWWAIIDGEYGCNAAVILAFLVKETRVGTLMGQLAGSKCLGGIRVHTDWGRMAYVHHTADHGDFAGYNTYEDAIRDECEIFSLSIYIGLSLSQIIAVYAPASDQNSPESYYSQMCGRLRSWQAASGL